MLIMLTSSSLDESGPQLDSNDEPSISISAFRDVVDDAVDDNDDNDGNDANFKMRLPDCGPSAGLFGLLAATLTSSSANYLVFNDPAAPLLINSFKMLIIDNGTTYRLLMNK
jgi:hypothetical protein